MRKVNENSPDVGGMFLMLTPPMSNDVHVFSGGFGAVGLGLSATDAVVAVDAPAAEPALGEAPFAIVVEDVEDGVPLVSPSLVTPFDSEGLIAFGF